MNDTAPGATHSATETKPTTQPKPDDAGDMKNIRQRRLAAAGVAGAALLLYLCCLSPTVTYTGDCGELIAASYRLGIAHPTGYPLYCLLGRLFALIVPFGEIGWRYNLFSAVAGAATIGLVTATVHRLLAHPSFTTLEYSDNANSNNATSGAATDSRNVVWSAAGAGLLLAGFYYFGSQSVIAEVYVLSAFFQCALLYIAICWHHSIEQKSTPDWHYAYLLGFLFGLALNTHLSCIFLVPGLLLYVVVQHRAHWSPRCNSRLLRHVVIIICCFLLAYSLTLYLPLRARAFPEPLSAGNDLYWWRPLDWTHPVDFPRWLAHVTGRQYRKLLLSPHEVAVAGQTLRYPWFAQPFSTTAAKASALAEAITLQYLWLTPLLIIGAIVAFRASRRGGAHFGSRWLGALLLSIVFLNVGVQIHYSVGDFSNFFFPAYIVFAIWMGLGLKWFFDAMQRRGESLARKTAQPMWSWRLKTLAPIILLATVMAQWAFFLPLASFRNNVSARTAGLERATAAETLMSRSSHAPSLLLLNDDTLFSFWYVQQVLHRAAGVRTPWGPPRRKISEENRLIELVTDLQKAGPVALAQWDGATDNRFPYTNLTPSGNLWLASHRALPKPATRVTDSINTHLPAGAIVRAEFRHPRLHLQELAAFEVEFTLPTWAAGAKSYLKVDARNRTAYVGWIEVFIAQHELLSTLLPEQEDIRVKHPTLDKLLAWKQSRRLIVPIGTSAGTHLQAVLPLQPEVESPVGDCDIWVRLVPHKHDRSTPWQRATPVRLTQK